MFFDRAGRRLYAATFFCLHPVIPEIHRDLHSHGLQDGFRIFLRSPLAVLMMASPRNSVAASSFRFLTLRFFVRGCHGRSEGDYRDERCKCDQSSDTPKLHGFLLATAILSLLYLQRVNASTFPCVLSPSRNAGKRFLSE